MPSLSKIAGSKIYIGGLVTYKSIVTLPDFAGQTWTEIGGWATSGDLGTEQEAITQTLINQNITVIPKA